MADPTPTIWLIDVQEGRWARLADAMRSGLPVPNGFVVTPQSPEKAVRSAYDDIKIREHTHYVAIRGPSHAWIEVIGPDALIHTLRRLWRESPDAEVLVQCMINASWCGKASWDKDLRILASEGLSCLDPDIYINDKATLYTHPRKVFRGVDGTTRTMRILGERNPLQKEYLKAISDLAKRAESDITWVLDDRRVWLLTRGEFGVSGA